MTWHFVKDPDALLDYTLDWSSWLGDDTITTSTWAATPSGIVIDHSQLSTKTSTVWLGGGTVDLDYLVTNHVVTSGGRQQDATIKVSVRQT